MTVMYTDKVATATFACFLKLLIRWRGSVFKLLWKELTVYLIAYYILSVVYRFVLTDVQKKTFEGAVSYCKTYREAIQLVFTIKSYIGIVMSRWKDQFNNIPWPDSIAMFVVAYVTGGDDRGRLMRRTIVRYINLSYVLTMRSISPPVKKRFPTLDHMTNAGLMLPAEQKAIQNIKTPYNKYPVPVLWANTVITRARKEGRIASDYSVALMFQTINIFRTMLAKLFLMDSVSIPILYTQVVTVCTYMYIAFSVVTNQFIHAENVKDVTQVDLFIPIAGIVEFILYIGLLKVAEVAINPFGEDDDDFEINAYIDRNWQLSYLVVDDMHSAQPELVRDKYWDTVEFHLPYTAANAALTTEQSTFEQGSMEASSNPAAKKKSKHKMKRRKRKSQDGQLGGKDSVMSLASTAESQDDSHSGSADESATTLQIGNLRSSSSQCPLVPPMQHENEEDAAAATAPRGSIAVDILQSTPATIMSSPAVVVEVQPQQPLSPPPPPSPPAESSTAAEPPSADETAAADTESQQTAYDNDESLATVAVTTSAGHRSNTDVRDFVDPSSGNESAGKDSTPSPPAPRPPNPSPTMD